VREREARRVAAVELERAHRRDADAAVERGEVRLGETATSSIGSDSMPVSHEADGGYLASRCDDAPASRPRASFFSRLAVLRDDELATASIRARTIAFGGDALPR
jgi:hypothetical protein